MMNHTQTALVPKRSHYPALVISLCAAFLFYKYILQVYPSVITQPLMREFNLTGAGLGNLAATFYYTYMITQLFVGVLLDKYSPRLLTASAIFCCALGAVIFSGTHSLLYAQMSRGLMGVGVAFATVAYMKLASLWFPPRHYAFIGGLLATAAMAGAVFGEAPLSYLMHTTSWRTCLLLTGVVGMLLALAFVVLVRDRKAHPEMPVSTTTTVTFKDILSLLKSKQNWLLTLYSGLAFSPVAIFGGLWGNPFLQQAYQVNSTESASMISLVFIGLGIGSPILGLISDKLNKRRHVMMICTFISCLALVAAIYVHHIPLWLVSCLLFTFGFGIGSFMLVFTIGKEINLPILTGTVIAMINTSEALLDSITEPGIGKLLDVFWDGKVVDGVHYFSLQSYHIALGVLPVYLLIATLLLFFVRDR